MFYTGCYRVRTQLHRISDSAGLEGGRLWLKYWQWQRHRYQQQQQTHDGLYSSDGQH